MSIISFFNPVNWTDRWGSLVGRPSPHKGVDVAPQQAPIRVPILRTGRLVESSPSGSVGHYIIVQVGPDDYDTYSHVVHDGGRLGQPVYAGDESVIRLAGWNDPHGADWSGIHLHFTNSDTLYGWTVWGEHNKNPENVIMSVLTALASGGTAPIGDDDMNQTQYDYLLNCIRRAASGRVFFDAGNTGALAFTDPKVTRALVTPPPFATGADARLWILSADPERRQAEISQTQAFNEGGGFVAVAELPDGVPSWMFDKYLDFWALDHPWGTFVKNTFELDAGPTRQIRSDGRVDEYPSRQAVWSDGRDVEITKGGKIVRKFIKSGATYSVELADGTRVKLNQTQIDRANAQRPDGQTWVTA